MREELRLRDLRNEMIKKQLLEGHSVAYRQSGWSLWPKVESNDCCFYNPVRFEESVQKDDIVFCQVQPRGYFYAHLVKEVEFDKQHGCRKYWISNMKGFVNGWCHIHHIYGKLFQIQH